MKKKNFAIKAKQPLATLIQKGRLRAETEINHLLQLEGEETDPWHSCFSIKLTPQL